MMTDPTMKKSSKAGNSNNLQLSEKNQELFQKLEILEEDLRSLQKPNNPQNQRRDLTGTSNGGSILTSFDQLLENSPRELMSSLQSKISPSDDISNARNCDIAVEEVIMGRRDVIMSGKLKGRRLVFDSMEVANEITLGWDYEVNSGVMIQEREVIMNENCDDGKMSLSRSCTFSGSILSEEEVVEEEEKTVVEAEKSGCRRLRGGGVGRFMVVAMAWLVILLFAFVFGLISMRCNGESVHGGLVPT